MVTSTASGPLNLAPSNPMNRATAGTLICEVIVFGLAFPGMVIVSNTAVWLACVGTIVPCLLCLAACATLRRPIGYPLGWLAQLCGVLMGFLTPMMFVMGGIFLVLWVLGFVLGKRLETRTA